MRKESNTSLEAGDGIVNHGQKFVETMTPATTIIVVAYCKRKSHTSICTEIFSFDIIFNRDIMFDMGGKINAALNRLRKFIAIFITFPLLILLEI